MGGKLTTIRGGAASYYTSASLGGPITTIGAGATYSPRRSTGSDDTSRVAEITRAPVLGAPGHRTEFVEIWGMATTRCMATRWWAVASGPPKPGWGTV